MTLDHRVLSEYILTDELDTQSPDFRYLTSAISKLHPEETDALINVILAADVWAQSRVADGSSNTVVPKPMFGIGGVNSSDDGLTQLFSNEEESASATDARTPGLIGGLAEIRINGVSIYPDVDGNERSLIIKRAGLGGIETYINRLNPVLLNSILPCMPDSVRAALVLGQFCQNTRMVDVCMPYLTVGSYERQIVQSMGIKTPINFEQVHECVSSCYSRYDLPAGSVLGEIEICTDNWKSLGCCVVAANYIGFEFYDGEEVSIMNFPTLAVVRDLMPSSDQGYNEVNEQYYPLMWKTLLPYLMYNCNVLVGKGFTSLGVGIPTVESDPPIRAVVNSVAGLWEELDRLAQEAKARMAE